MDLGIRQAAKDPPVGSLTKGDSSAAFEGADEVGQPLSCCCDATVYKYNLLEDAAAELRLKKHQQQDKIMNVTKAKVQKFPEYSAY